MTPLVAAFLIGAIAGLRTMTAPAFVAWAARLGMLRLDGTLLSFLGLPVTAWVFTVLALGELVADKLPRTPARTRPGPFVARIVSGAMSGGAITAGAAGSLAAGAVLGAIGALAGTLAGYNARVRLVPALEVPDTVVALAEDLVAVGGALLIVAGLNGAAGH
jgi:uncharacterized membrane protein